MADPDGVDFALARAAREVALEDAAQAVGALRAAAPNGGEARTGYLRAIEDAVKMVRSLAAPTK